MSNRKRRKFLKDKNASGGTVTMAELIKRGELPADVMFMNSSEYRKWAIDNSYSLKDWVTDLEKEEQKKE